jgi:hypothetical protein
MKALKKLAVSALLIGTLGGVGVASSGCAYGGVAASGDWAVVTVNNGFLFGIMRKAYVCKISPEGLSNCSASESP